MPRPKLQSDEVILDAARLVLKRLGPSDFTLNDVAVVVGLSRAALIQRFGGKDQLLHAVMVRAVVQTREHLAALPLERSPAGLRSFLRTLCQIMGSGSGFEMQLLIAWRESRDPALKKLAFERYGLVIEALAARIPLSLQLPPKELAELLHSILAGAAMHWLVEDTGRLDDFLERRLAQAVDLLVK